MNTQLLDVWFIVTEDVSLLDLIGLAEALTHAGEAYFRLNFAGAPGQVIHKSGMVVGHLQPLPPLFDRPTLLVLPNTGAAVATPGGQAMVQWLRMVLQQDKVELAALNGAILYAAQAGLLDGRHCTAHFSLTRTVKAMAPQARLEEMSFFCNDGPIWTASGRGSVMDFALSLIARKTSPQIAADVARQLWVYNRRAKDDPQLSPWLLYRDHLHPAVHRLQDAIVQDLTASWSAADMAHIAGSSVRQMNRLFAEYAQISPRQYLLEMRVAQAELLRSQGGYPMQAIAQQSGFGSSRDLRRVLARHRIPAGCCADQP